MISEDKEQRGSTSGGQLFVDKSQSQRHRDISFSKVGDFLESLEHDCGEKGTKKSRMLLNSFNLTVAE